MDIDSITRAIPARRRAPRSGPYILFVVIYSKLGRGVPPADRWQYRSVWYNASNAALVVLRKTLLSA
jgi:hypothetical protein